MTLKSVSFEHGPSWESSEPQVFMWEGGELAVHNNVTFEANTAGSRGGAVSLPFNFSCTFMLWYVATGFLGVDLDRVAVR